MESDAPQHVAASTHYPAVQSKSTMWYVHRIARIFYQVVFVFLGGNLVASLAQGVLESGGSGIPSADQIKNIYLIQLATRNPIVFIIVVSLVISLGIGGLVADRILYESVKLSQREEVIEAVRKRFYLSATGQAIPVPTAEAALPEPVRVDWGEALDIVSFYGRANELIKLEQLVTTEHCRVVAVLGIGGIGKTTLARKVALQSEDKFDRIFWRSLQNAPLLSTVLSKCILFLSGQRRVDIPDDIDEQVSILLDFLKLERCLLVLDNVESIMQSGSRAGDFREGYEDYGALFQRLGETAHRSCLLLTSREKPKEIASLEGNASPVRSLTLKGLSDGECRNLLGSDRLSGTDDTWKALNHLYSGNPLNLRLVARTIQELFGNDIGKFLTQGEAIVGNIRDPLDLQFRRMTDFERTLMYWLAVEREPVPIDVLYDDIVGFTPKNIVIGALESLKRRSIIETDSAVFALQPTILEYVTSRFTEMIADEFINDMNDHLSLLISHAVIKAQAKDYVRDSQIRLVLAPIAHSFVNTLGRSETEAKLRRLLSFLRTSAPQRPGYAAGNILNILIHLGYSLKGYDFSNLVICQAYLRGVILTDVNFSHCQIAKSVFTESFGSILSVTLSPDGQFLAAGTPNAEILLWQVSTGVLIRTYTGHSDWVRSLAFSPDGTMLVSSSDDQTIRLWDVDTGQCLNILQGHANWVRSVAFSSDGIMLASGSDDQTIRLWDVATGQCLNTLQGHTNRVWSVAFNPAGTMLASGSEDRTIRLWDVATGQCLNTLQGHTNRVYSAAFNPAGTMLASGSEDQTIRLWDVTTGQCLNTLQGHSSWIWSVAFNPAGTMLASGSEDRTIRLWDVATGQCLNTLQGHTNRVWSVAFNPAGTMLASGSEDQTIRLWDVATGQCLNTLQGYTNRVWSVAFNPAGTLLASGHDDQTIRLWDVATGQCLNTLQGHTNRVQSIAFNHAGTMIASGSEDRTIYLWEVSGSQAVRVLRGHTNWVRSVAFGPDDIWLVSGNDDQTVRLWDINHDKSLHTLQSDCGRVFGVAFSPLGESVASGGEDNLVRLLDIDTGDCLRLFAGHADRVWSVSYSPNGTLVASGSEDWTIRLWDIEGDKCLRVLSGHTDLVRSVAFSGDGHWLVTGSHDHTIRIWEVGTGRCLATGEGHTNLVWSVAFSPNGSTVASGSTDGTIKLWNASDCTCQQTMRTDRPYERLIITRVSGLTSAQKSALKALGAIETEDQDED